MKKIIALLLAIGMSLTILTSCGEDASESSSSASDLSEEDVQYVGYSYAEDPNIIINNFDCDNWDILIGEEVTVTFTAEILSTIDLGPEDVYVIDSDDNIIGYMNDSGTDGDEKADDFIFTLKYTCESDEPKIVSCHAVAGSSESMRIPLNFWRHYTDEDYELADLASETLNEAISDYLTEEGEISEDDVPEVMYELVNSLDDLVADGVVDHYEVNDSCITYETSTGYPLIFVLPIEDCFNSITTFDMYDGGANSTINKVTSKIAETFPDYSETKTIISSETTIEDLKSISDYNIIFLVGHGSYNEEYGSLIYTNIDPSISNSEEFRSQYEQDVNAHRILINSPDKKGAGKCFVTSSFFKYYLYYNRFTADSFIYMTECQSCMDMKDKGDEALVQTFLDLGATCVIANTDTTHVNYALKMMESVIDYMCQPEENGITYHTVSEALELAKGDCGEKDFHLIDVEWNPLSIRLCFYAEVKVFPEDSDYRFSNYGEIDVEIDDLRGEAYFGGPSAVNISNPDETHNTSMVVKNSAQFQFRLPAGEYLMDVQVGQRRGDKQLVTVEGGKTIKYYVSLSDLSIKLTSEQTEQEDSSITENSDDVEIQAKENAKAENSSSERESEGTSPEESTSAESSIKGSTSEESSSAINTPVESPSAQNSSSGTAENQGRYVTSLAEIPNSAMENMKSKAEAAIRSNADNWSEESHLTGIDYKGRILVTSKETDPKRFYNYIDVVFEVSLTIDPEGYDSQDFTYYTYCEFGNAMILADGTFSRDDNFTLTYATVFLPMESGSLIYEYKGYSSLEKLIEEREVTSYFDNFEIDLS